MIASGQNDMTFRYVGQDVRGKVLQLRKEAEAPLQHVLSAEKELRQAENQLGATKRELLSLSDGTAPAYEGQPDWDAIEKRQEDLRIAFPQEQIEVNGLSEQLRYREVPLHELANRSAALLCRPFVEALHEVLPAELRDEVYNFLWDEDAIDLVEEQLLRDEVYNFFWDENAIDLADEQLALPHDNVQNERLSNDWVLKVPYFVNANIVGESFAREAATYFFRMVMDVEIDYRLVQAYLRMENFGNMTLRPREIIRLLRIDLVWSFSSNHFAYADLQANLESLLDLPVRDDFAIEVFIPRDMQFSRTIFHVLDIIKPIYHAFVARGMAIKVLGYGFFTPSWRQLTDRIYGPEPNQFCTTAELLNCYFDRTTEEWFTMKDAEIAAIKNPRRRQRCYQVLEVMRQNFEDVGILVWDGDTPRVTWPDERRPPYARPGGLFG